MMHKSRHSNYQNFSEYSKKTKKNIINLDKLRFDWVEKLISSKIKIYTVTDIGSNLGYMCLKFNKIFKSSCTGFEYERPAYNKAKKIAKSKKNIKYFNKGLTLSTLNSLNKSDLIVHLNVLHHAGHMYDKKLINNSRDWKNYSLKYLKILSKKSKFLFFQTGNVNFNKNYFLNEETFNILPNLLNSSGWKIINI